MRRRQDLDLCLTKQALAASSALDHELERLAVAVMQTYGDRAITQAYVRVLAATPADDMMSNAVDACLGAVHGPHMRAVDAGEFIEGLKAEFRRLLTSH